MRRACHEALSKARVIEYRPQQANNAVRLVDGMLQHPEGWAGEFRRWVDPSHPSPQGTFNA